MDRHRLPTSGRQERLRRDCCRPPQYPQQPRPREPRHRPRGSRPYHFSSRGISRINQQLLNSGHEFWFAECSVRSLRLHKPAEHMPGDIDLLNSAQVKLMNCCFPSDPGQHLSKSIFGCPCLKGGNAGRNPTTINSEHVEDRQLIGWERRATCLVMNHGDVSPSASATARWVSPSASRPDLSRSPTDCRARCRSSPTGSFAIGTHRT